MKSNRTNARLSVLLLALAVAVGVPAARSQSISGDLQNLPSGTPVQTIVQYKREPSEADHALAKRLGATKGNDFRLMKAAKYRMTPSAAAALARQNSNIKYISPDRPVYGAMNIAGAAVNADLVQSLGYDGTGIGVAIVDSGVNDVADLGIKGVKATRVLYSQNFAPGTQTTADLYGHGTHVAGIVAGNGASSSCSNCDVTFQGIAPNSNIINLRVLDAKGSATDSTVINAIQSAILLKARYNIRVINLSLGRGIWESYTLDPLCQAVEQAWKAGIVVVVAAGNYGRDNTSGNNGYATITAPGNDPYVITVGAMNTLSTPTRADDVIASYSSKGPTLLDHVMKPDLVAPGNQIISSLASTNDTLYSLYPQDLVPISYYTTSNDSNASSDYFKLSGTSMAAPMVSGAVALLLQQNPFLSPDQIKARLMKTANKSFPSYSSYSDPVSGMTYTSEYDAFTVGAGYLDIYQALNSTDLAPTTSGSALSPKVNYDPKSGNVYVVTSSSVIWGNSVVWGNSVIWGTAEIWTTSSGQSVIWGNSVVWGNATGSAFSVIWGNAVSARNQISFDAQSVAGWGDQ
jgi:serine protease AprX